MGDSSLYVSNGDCYYGEGQISDPRFIPCGNAELSGTQSCCFQGDFCLASSVCYDNDSMRSNPLYVPTKPPPPYYIGEEWDNKDGAVHPLSKEEGGEGVGLARKGS